ncbi:hypothetical protein [Capnocytophaga canimorsus]|uniref:hypothetical protein n=1 Tax=Capnocytophaga canimorsus TaxID=28188 RepID=UPI001EDDEB5F|nr:hypothetical protein [Capnocytophaga canimorsus]GJQ03767.1 hypothetical protein CAPN009_01820 [Capnocytophaga canimorsus]
MEKEIELLKSILAENFKYYKYNEAVKRVIVTLEKGNISNEIWIKIKILINNRLLPKGAAFDLIAYDANLPLNEDTEQEAYRWLDLFIKNVENKNNIVEYGQELENNKSSHNSINGRDFTKEE